MRTQTVEVDARFGPEYAGKYVFGEIAWAKRSRIIQKHTKYNPVTGRVMGSDYVAIQAETIWAALREQPDGQPITLEKLLSEEEGIPIELGELFSRVVNRLCGLTVDETRFLSKPCEETSHIQASQSSDSAKSLGGPLASSRGNQPKPSKSSS